MGERGLTINPNNGKKMLDRVFGDTVDSRNRGDTGLRHLVVAMNIVIWDYHCGL